jgi:hypothetical protein
MYLGDQIQKNKKMQLVACISAERRTQSFVVRREETSHLADLGVDGRIILKYFLKK